VLLMAGLVPILIALTWAGSRYGWGSWQIVSLLCAGVVFMLFLLLNERRAPEPVISPSLFSNPVFSVSLAVGLLVSMGMFGSLMFLPLFIQGVLGLQARDAGAILTPMMLSFVAGSIAGGQIITRTGKYKIQALAGTAAMVLGMFLLLRMGVHTRWPRVVVNMLVLGVSIGVVFPLLNVAIQNAFPYRIMGVVNATQQFVRSLGGVIAAPILGTMLTSSFAKNLESEISPGLRKALDSLPQGTRSALLHPQGLTNPQAQDAVRRYFSVFGDRSDKLYSQFIDAVRSALASGFHRLFVLTLVFAVIAFIVTFFLKEIPLKRDEYYE
jgi:MFS family permease